MPTINGNNKNNKLKGDSDVFGVTNHIYGFGGDDTLEGGFHASNHIWGGDGNDIIRGGIGINRLYGDAGDDHIEVVWNAPDSKLYGGSGNDTLVSGQYSDGFHLMGEGGLYMDGGKGADLMIGGAGGDIFIVDNARDKVVETWVPEFDNIPNPVDIVRASLSYALTADARIEILETTNVKGTKAIELSGNGFSQTIRGNAGNNTLSGLGGNDILDGGLGNDRMIGGTGNDIYIVDSSKDVVIEKAGQGTDTVKASISYALPADVENLILTGSRAINATGNAMANTITGNSAANVLKGGGGNDKLSGGGGADSLYGGAGKDVFIFKSLADSTVAKAGRDTIHDFKSDVIDLRAIDANTELAGDQSFSFINAKAFSGSAGELRYDKGVLQGDVNGDSSADFAINVSGAPVLTMDMLLL